MIRIGPGRLADGPVKSFRPEYLAPDTTRTIRTTGWILTMIRTASALRSTLEQLEARENPSVTWAGESFDSLAAPVLPQGWSAWSNDGQQQYITTKLAAVSGSTSLASLGATSNSSRFWNQSTFPGDYGAAFSIRAGTSVRMDAIARGVDLDTDKPSYVAAEFSGSRNVELFEVNEGGARSLGRVNSLDSLTGKWVRVSLKPVGEWAGVTVQRLDTGAYLRGDGTWQAAETEVIRVRTSIPSRDGYVGLGRRTGGSGMALVDDFAVLAPPGVNESFDTSLRGTVPANWNTWSNNRPTAFTVGAGRALSPALAIASDGLSTTQSRAWLGSSIAADASAGVAVYADNLIPSGVFVRGNRLETAQPTYYQLTVVRGLNVQLKSVVNGAETVLGTIRSSTYVSGTWIRLTLVAEGSRLRAVVFRTDTNQWLTATGSWSNTAVAALDVMDSRIAGGGFVGIERGRAAAGAVWFDDFQIRPAGSTPLGTSPPTSPPPVVTPAEIGAVPRADIAHKYTHIRLAQLAYHGNPVGEFEKDLARDSLDLIIPNPLYLQAFETAAPALTKIVYTNLSNIYGDLLTDWNAYADANRLSREQAFYHVAQATAFTGSTQSSQPVYQLWNAQRLNVDGTGAPVNLTSEARGTRAPGVTFGGVGSAIALGFPERFRELNFNLVRPAAAGWNGVLEYVSAANADGSPAVWKTLTLSNDGTGGLHASGTITFDPPADWVSSKVAGGTQRLHQLRFRTLTGTDADAPVARTIFGRDYAGGTVQSNGQLTGTIPAFDSTADINADGYLSDAEYRNRRAGFDARFEYESRLFYPYYGQMRFVVNPSTVAIKAWNIDYHRRVLAANPLADGLFLDNSHGKLPFAGTPVKESVAVYTQEYAALVASLTRAIAPKWTVSNTAGSIAEGDPVARASTAVFEEFVLRPNSSNWAQVRDIADLIARRLNADSPSPYVILDTHSGSLPTNDPRSQIGSLAYYYLLADPDKTFLMFNGGQSPAAPWSQVWVPAAATNVGRPTGTMTTWATGLDPQNSQLTYKVLRRDYSNAISLFKPLSYTLGVGTGTTADATATVHQLGGNYRQLNADGTLGAVITSISLRGGEGAVLMRA